MVMGREGNPVAYKANHEISAVVFSQFNLETPNLSASNDVNDLKTCVKCSKIRQIHFNPSIYPPGHEIILALQGRPRTLKLAQKMVLEVSNVIICSLTQILRNCFYY